MSDVEDFLWVVGYNKFCGGNEGDVKLVCSYVLLWVCIYLMDFYIYVYVFVVRMMYLKMFCF